MTRGGEKQPGLHYPEPRSEERAPNNAELVWNVGRGDGVRSHSRLLLQPAGVTEFMRAEGGACEADGNTCRGERAELTSSRPPAPPQPDLV